MLVVVNCFQIWNLRSLIQQKPNNMEAQISCELLSNLEFTFFDTTIAASTYQNEML